MNQPTILLVEDQAVIGADLEATLTRYAYHVCGIAASGEEALALAHQHRPQLVLMDIRIDGAIDGIETAAALRRECDVPVIFLSAYFDCVTLQRAKQVAPYGFLVKPFNERELQLNIEVALHKHACDRELAIAHAEIKRLNGSLEDTVAQRTEQLQAALTEIEGFVHAAAHHLRSPLRAMEGYAQLLLRLHGSSLPKEIAHFPVTIAASAQRVAQLVDDLLAFINLRERPLRLERVDIDSLARASLESLLAATPSAQVRAIVEALPECHADADLLDELLKALLSNALKFSRHRAPATIVLGVQTVQARGVAVAPQLQVYFVRDNGIGIDPRFADSLFTLFGQLNLPEQYEGTGSGLAKARRIVERMGGRIWLTSRPDQGATFYFSLPRPL